MTRILFFEQSSWEAEYLKKELSGHELIFVERKLDAHVAGDEHAEIISIFVGSSISPEVLKKFPRLRMIATQSTGFDHIDLAACAQRGIIVSNVPTYGARTVAEYTFTLLLALTRKLLPAVERVRTQYSFSLDGLRGSDLYRKTFGCIGCGHIGQEAMKIANGFSMKVVAYDVAPKPELARELNFRYVALEELLALSDVISLHVPYNAGTHHLLNADNMKKIKRGAVLVNTARGPVVDTAVLFELLENGTVAAAGLDVLEEEGAIKEERELVVHGQPDQQRLRTVLQNHLLIRMPNVIVTPHNAFNTDEALLEIVRTTVENIRAFLSGRPQNVVGKLPQAAASD